MDALVEEEIIEDDNYLFVTSFASKFGEAGKDVGNYVEIELTGEIDEDWISHKCSMSDEAKSPEG